MRFPALLLAGMCERKEPETLPALFRIKLKFFHALYWQKGIGLIIGNGKSQAEIQEHGAYVKSLAIDGNEVLKPSEDGEQTHGGMALLLPFANRVRNAKYLWGGKEYSLPKNNGIHSIHGLTRGLQWNLDKISEDKVQCTLDLKTSVYPSEVFLSVVYEVGKDFFTTSITAENRGNSSAPFMAGMHPYFRFNGYWSLESMQNLLRLNYESGYFPDGSLTPVKPMALNSRSGIPFDNTYLTNSIPILSAGDRKVIIETVNMPYLVLYNGEYAKGVSVAAEPMTGAPDSFNNGIGLVAIPPGGNFHCSARFRLL